MKKILNCFVFNKRSQFRNLFISLRKLILLNLGRVLFYFIFAYYSFIFIYKVIIIWTNLQYENRKKFKAFMAQMLAYP